MKLVIKGELAGLNEHDNANRRNRYLGAKLKKENTEIVYWHCREQELTVRTKPVFIEYRHYVKNRRKDPDNFCHSRKYINDGLVKAGILYDDSMKWIKGFKESWKVDKDNPRIVIKLLD